MPTGDDHHRIPAALIWASCLSLAAVPFAGLVGVNLLVGVLARVFGWTVPRWLLWTDGTALVALGLVAAAGALWLYSLVGRGK
jgi:hypothetical protein